MCQREVGRRVAPRLPSGPASSPSKLGANEWRGHSKRGHLGLVSMLILNGLGCTRIVQEKMPKLTQARNHLTPGRRLVLSAPSPFGLLSFLYGHFMYPKTCQNPEDACWFCIATITELSNRLGFHLSHYDLIEDYRLDDPSLRYRSIVRLVGLLGCIIPKRLRCNTMVFGLEPRV